MKNKNLEKITERGFEYIKQYFPDKDLEIYEKPKSKIIYNKKTDEIVMEIKY